MWITVACQGPTDKLERNRSPYKCKYNIYFIIIWKLLDGWIVSKKKKKKENRKKM
jgi:hypothetical protein